MALIDIGAANALFQAQSTSNQLPVEEVQKLLLESVRSSAERLGVTESLDHSWIVFKTHSAAAVAEKAAVAENETAPVVLTFDEATGSAKNQQIDFSEKPKHARPPQKLPWRN